MAVTTTQSRTHHRPASVLVTVGVLTFLGVSALAGGVALVTGVGVAPPDEWLDQIPLVDSWTVPGLVLGVGFGLGALVAVYGLLRRPRWRWLGVVERLTGHHWSWVATVLIGLAHLAWITLEVSYLPELSALQAIYGGVGLALVLLPMVPSARGYLRADPAR